MRENKMGNINWNNIHIRKEAIVYKYERHMNPCMKNADLNSTIILKFS